MIRSKIIGTGSYLPEKVMTNEDWAKLVDTSDEWITTRTGIKKRHFAPADEANSDLVVRAAESAIANANINRNEIDAIIIGTITPDTPYPATANWVQKKLKLNPMPSFDIGAACCGFLYGLIIADSLIKTNLFRTVLVAGVETMTRVMDWEDRNTCVLFGDGAGAVLLARDESGEKGILSTYWSGDGNLGDLLYMPAGGSAIPASYESVKNKLHTVHMKGNEVFKNAVLRMQEAAVRTLEKANLSVADVDLFIPHQANIRIINATIERTGIPLSRTFINIQETANMSSATIPVALDQANKSGRILPGHKVLMSAFGAGFTWAGVVVQF